MGLLSKHQVDEYLASGAPFSDVCDEAVGCAYIRGIETGSLDSFLFGDENGPLVMELLTDDDELGLTENLFGPDYRIKGPETGIVQEDDLFRYPFIDKCLPHLFGLVITSLMVVPADKDPVNLSGLIEFYRRIDPV